MITFNWWADPARNADRLKCELINLDKGTLDTVMVYFNSKFDVDTIKGLKLEADIARAIFSNRAKYGSAIDAYLTVYPNTIHFKTGTDVIIHDVFGGEE